MSLFPDPTTLTKSKLKEELQRRKIKLPNTKALKQEYVDLYVKHILGKDGVEEAEADSENRGDDSPHFSSDDDELLNEAVSEVLDQAEADSTDDEITFKQVYT